MPSRPRWNQSQTSAILPSPFSFFFHSVCTRASFQSLASQEQTKRKKRKKNIVLGLEMVYDAIISCFFSYLLSVRLWFEFRVIFPLCPKRHVQKKKSERTYKRTVILCEEPYENKIEIVERSSSCCRFVLMVQFQLDIHFFLLFCCSCLPVGLASRAKCLSLEFLFCSENHSASHFFLRPSPLIVPPFFYFFLLSLFQSKEFELPKSLFFYLA